ncbi:MAG TPA: c-type cytochrome [Myxococcales bacterium]|nr:c-type cytochrome [Myxococcales bacterium]
MATKPLELQSLKWPFVGLAVLLALCTGWSVWDEVVPRRPWKNFQREFFKLEESHLKADLARAQKRLEEADTKAKLDALRKELQEATVAISGNPKERQAYDAAVKADDEARIKEAEAKLYLGFDKSKQDAIYYKLREARHDEHAKEEAALQKEFDEWQRKIDEKQRLYDAAIAHHKETTKARETFQARKDKAQGELDKIEKPIEDLKKKIETSSGKWPQMDQYWIQDLKNSWGGPTVDRCQNCHMAVNKGGYSAPWEVLEARKNKMSDADMKAQFALDPEVIDAYQTVHDKICEDLPPAPAAIPPGGWQPPAPPAPMDPASARECRPAKTYEHWLERAEAYCGSSARWLAKTKVVLKDKKGTVIAAAEPEYKGVARNPAADAMKDEGKPHAEIPVAQACTDKDTAVAFDEADKADLYDVKPVFRTHPHRWTLLVQNHIPEQVGCTVCHGGEGMQTKGVEHKAFRHGEDDHYWNDPLTDEVEVMGHKYKGAFLQAKCDQCHYQELNVNYAPLLAKGKKLFTDVGCWGCHPIEGYNDLPKRGPTLLTISSKTTPGWLHTWISYPKGWRPATRMPNFWPGAVSADAVPHPEGTSDEQIVAEHKKVREEEVAQIAAYIWTNQEPSKLLASKAPQGDAAKGKQIFDSVGCRACHVYEKDSAARRSEGSPLRDYAPNLWNIADKAKPEWIYSWVKNPKAMWPQTKMPDLRLTDQEAANVTAFLVTLRSDQKYVDPPEYAPGQEKQLAQLAEQGKALINKYGCFGCHDIKGFENAQKIGTELTEHGRKDPNLLDFGDVRYFTEDPRDRETYPNWVWEKLHVPRVFGYERVETRMPQFDFSDDEALSILVFLRGQTGDRPDKKFLASQDQQRQSVARGEQLVFWNGCRNCHVVEGRGGAIRDMFNDDNQTFAPPIITGEGWRTQPEWLYAFLKGPIPLRPWLDVRMPTFHFSDADATGVVQYFSAASNKPFPYITAEAPGLPPAQAKEATALMAELKCLSCHVVGKLAPNQDPASAAPNFQLAKHRLRPDWIIAWLQNPNALQEGTRMPSFWDFSDPAHPTTNSQTFKGDARTQIEALRDLLMHLGEPGYAAPPPRTAQLERPRG